MYCQIKVEVSRKLDHRYYITEIKAAYYDIKIKEAESIIVRIISRKKLPDIWLSCIRIFCSDKLYYINFVSYTIII